MLFLIEYGGCMECGGISEPQEFKAQDDMIDYLLMKYGGYKSIIKANDEGDIIVINGKKMSFRPTKTEIVKGMELK